MGNLVLAGATSGSTTISPTDTVTITCTLPSTGGTIQTSGAGFTTNGVAYASSTSALTTGSGLKFDGTNLGLGATPSAWFNDYRALQIAGSASLSGRTTATGYMQLMVNVYRDASANYVYNATGAAGQYFMQDNQHIWYNAPSGTAGNTISFTEAMRLDSSGNLGIGTSSPSAKLDVAGSAYVRGDSTNATFTSAGQLAIKRSSSDPVFSFHNNTGGQIGYIQMQNTGTCTIGVAVAQPLAFNTNGTEAMRIDSSGNLLMGTTSNVSFGIGAKLYVQGNGVGLAVGYGTSTSQYRMMYFNSGDAAMYFNNNSNYAYLSSAGAWTNASDARLKKNIVDIKYGLADVLKAQPRSYQMHDIVGDFVGFVAQELQEVIPEVVSGDPEKQLGVDYGSLVAVAFKAIQELSTLITAQSATIQSLTERITALEGART